MKVCTRLSLALVLLFVVLFLAACAAPKEETSVSGQLTETLNELYPEDGWNIASQVSVNRSVQTFSDPGENQIE